MLSIANWNLERITPSQKRADRIKLEIAKISADVWILTETHKDVGPEYFTSVTSTASQEGECWSSIWSKFPITPLMEYVSDKERCTAAKVTHPEYGDLIVYATVLPWVGSTWRGQSWDMGTAFISALTTYRGDWEKLQSVYPNAIHIIAGDFNQSLVDWHYYGSKQIRSRLEQTMCECNMTIVTAGIHDPIARDSKPHACIDHICMSTSKIAQVYNTKRWSDRDNPDKSLSDHFGVIVEIDCKI